VGEHRAAAQVAERPDVLGAGAQFLVDGQEPVWIRLQTQVFQSERVGVRGSPCGDAEKAGAIGASVSCC
jgi:hypothetical protein